MNYNEYCNEVRLKVAQLFTEKISDTYGATRVSSSKHRLPIKYIVLHTTANNASAMNEARNIANNNGINSFNVVVDEKEVVETVKFSNVSHHAGVKKANQESIGVELCETSGIDKGYQNMIKYLGWVCFQLNLAPSSSTIKFHNEFVSTSCGGYYRKLGLGNVISDISKYYNIARSGKQEDKPQHVERPSKVGEVLVVRKGSYPKSKFYAYQDKACTKPYAPWTVDKDLTFGIVEDYDPVFKCVQWGSTPMRGTDHVYIKWEPGIGFDKA
mgnify:FL=1